MAVKEDVVEVAEVVVVAVLAARHLHVLPMLLGTLAVALRVAQSLSSHLFKGVVIPLVPVGAVEQAV